MALATNGRQHMIIGFALLAIIVIGCSLRVVSATGDLWVDEIWSLDQIAVARASGAWRDWIALYFHDNSHALNTLYLSAIGPDAPMIVTRMLSLVSGIGTVIVAAAIGWRRSPGEGLLLMGLTALSYPLVHYAGEARGYGPMLLACYAAFFVLDAYLRRPTKSRLIGFVTITVLGFLAHLTFVVVLAGLGAWALISTYRDRRDVISTAAALVPLFGIQLVLVLAYGAVALNSFVIGGVTFLPAQEAVGIIAALTFGLNADWFGPANAAVILGLAGVVAVALVLAKGDSRWPIFLVVVLAFPLGGVLVERQPYVLPRYFIAAAPFALILAARCLMLIWSNGGWNRWLAGFLVAGFCMGNAMLLADFIRIGRGDYSAAIADMAAASPGPVRVAGTPGFSVGTMFHYHARRLELGRSFQYVSRDHEAGRPVDWYILGYLGGRAAPAQFAQSMGPAPSALYRLWKIYPHWGLSGDTWAVYRRE